MSIKNIENLKEAIRQEQAAITDYMRWANEAGEPRLEEMFRQFAKNESWHLAALREKLAQLEPK